MNDDSIRRKAAINAMCDACETVTAACPHFPCKRYLAIESLPQIDAVPVVRCRDCKHRFTFDCPRKIEIKNNALIAGGTFVISNTNDDSFCEKGERRE